MLIPIRKAQAGSDSLGHVWEEDGSVVRVSPQAADILLGIKDGGFSVADDGWPEPEVAQVPEVEVSAEFSEVDPKAETTSAPDADDDTEADAPAKPAAKKTAARKTAASKPE